MTLKRLTLAQSWGFGSLNIYIFGYLDVTQLMHFPARAASMLFCPYLGINLVSQNPQLCSKEKSCKLHSSRPSNTGNIFRATTCRATMLLCKLRWFVARVTTFLRNKLIFVLQNVDVAFYYSQHS